MDETTNKTNMEIQRNDATSGKGTPRRFRDNRRFFWWMIEGGSDVWGFLILQSVVVPESVGGFLDRWNGRFLEERLPADSGKTADFFDG
jgi:hypothetical protein